MPILQSSTIPGAEHVPSSKVGSSEGEGKGPSTLILLRNPFTAKLSTGAPSSPGVLGHSQVETWAFKCLPFAFHVILDIVRTGLWKSIKAPLFI